MTLRFLTPRVGRGKRGSGELVRVKKMRWLSLTRPRIHPRSAANKRMDNFTPVSAAAVRSI